VLFIVQIFAGVFALFLGTEIGRILQSKPLSDRQFNLYMLLALLFPAQWIYGSVVMSDLLLQLFLTSAVYFLLIISRENKSVAYWGFALSLSAGMLLKPVMAPIALLSPMLLVLRPMRSGGLKKILLMIPVLVFLGFSFRNHTMSGQFEYSSISHINLLQYNTRYLLNFTHGEQVSEEMLSDLMTIPRNEQDYDTWVNGVKQLGIQSISKHPFQYAWIHVSGMFRMLLDPGRFDLALLSNASYQESEGFLRALSTDGIQGLWKVLKQSPFFLILLFLGMIKLVKLALFFFACYQNRFNARLWMAIGIPVIILALTGPIGASRFMLPLVPIYLIVISMVKLRH
jgi:4-amino-4-deoxy-L-arabinose transferase-like glycosyltransferase